MFIKHDLLRKLTTYMKGGSEHLGIGFNIEHGVRFIPHNYWRVQLKRKRYSLLLHLQRIFSMSRVNRGRKAIHNPLSLSAQITKQYYPHQLDSPPTQAYFP